MGIDEVYKELVVWMKIYDLLAERDLVRYQNQLRDITTQVAERVEYYFKLKKHIKGEE